MSYRLVSSTQGAVSLLACTVENTDHEYRPCIQAVYKGRVYRPCIQARTLNVTRTAQRKQGNYSPDNSPRMTPRVNTAYLNDRMPIEGGRTKNKVWYAIESKHYDGDQEKEQYKKIRVACKTSKCILFK